MVDLFKTVRQSGPTAAWIKSSRATGGCLLLACLLLGQRGIVMPRLAALLVFIPINASVCVSARSRAQFQYVCDYVAPTDRPIRPRPCMQARQFVSLVQNIPLTRTPSLISCPPASWALSYYSRDLHATLPSEPGTWPTSARALPTPVAVGSVLAPIHIAYTTYLLQQSYCTGSRRSL
ncbi:hypothetical protein F4861DRAFT_518521 [Xylaria intraflava]|nr:hypothetical protein F4861DRAFT_518521 [Xylaria intraflava]